eukprot:3128554-Amphidinium_carterae.1
MVRPDRRKLRIKESRLDSAVGVTLAETYITSNLRVSHDDKCQVELNCSMKVTLQSDHLGRSGA